MRAVIALAFVLGSAAACLEAQEVARDAFVVIAHPDSPIETVTRRTLADIFLKKTTRWPNETTVLPVDQRPDAPIREAFSEVVLDRPVQAIRAYWQQMIFSGRAVPPPELNDDQAVINYVRANPGAVGYVPRSASIRDVRVVRLR